MENKKASQQLWLIVDKVVLVGWVVDMVKVVASSRTLITIIIIIGTHTIDTIMININKNTNNNKDLLSLALALQEFVSVESLSIPFQHLINNSNNDKNYKYLTIIISTSACSMSPRPVDMVAAGATSYFPFKQTTT